MYYMYGISVPEIKLRLPIEDPAPALPISEDEMCDLTTTCCDENNDGNESSLPESEDHLGKYLIAFTVM